MDGGGLERPARVYTVRGVEYGSVAEEGVVGVEGVSGGGGGGGGEGGGEGREGVNVEEERGIVGSLTGRMLMVLRSFSRGRSRSGGDGPVGGVVSGSEDLTTHGTSEGGSLASGAVSRIQLENRGEGEPQLARAQGMRRQFACHSLSLGFVIAVLVATGIVLGKSKRSEWRNLHYWLLANAILTVMYRGLKYAYDVARSRRNQGDENAGPSWLLAWSFRVVTWIAFWVFIAGFIMLVSYKKAEPDSMGNDRDRDVLALSWVIVVVDLAMLSLALSLAFVICICAPFGPAVRRRTRGANNALIDRVEKKVYKQGMLEEGAVCVICLENYEEGQRIRKLPCGPDKQHVYHASCIDQWLTRDKSCPVCKKDIDVGLGIDKKSRRARRTERRMLRLHGPQRSIENADREVTTAGMAGAPREGVAPQEGATAAMTAEASGGGDEQV